MKAITKTVSDTVISLEITVDLDELSTAKKTTVLRLAKDIKVAGFRAGKVPTEIAEKHLDANYLQGQTIEEALNIAYAKALTQEKIRVVARPKIEIKKFVPYTDLVFTAEVEVIGKVKLGDYKDLQVKKETTAVTVKDVDDVLKRLQTQLAEFSEVERQAKNGDRVWIDFEGKDDKGEPINNAKGQDYPLLLGSDSFIKGFEENVIGVKKGDKKSFELAFPKDYYVKALQSKKVTFDITAKKVEETTLLKLDDAFAAKVGPFKSLNDLKDDIKKQLTAEKDTQAQQKYEEAIIKAASAKTKVVMPESIITEQMDSLDKEFKQSLSRRGETFEDYLANNLLTEPEYREKELRPLAEERLKIGFTLSEIAEAEGITVTPDELSIRLQVLKNQYTDAKMQAELDKPENQNEIGARLLTEKTIHKLLSFVNKS
jgi:trigger factor